MDHYDITTYLRELETCHIFRLGGALGLHYTNLKKMRSPLDDMVEAWLRRDDSVLKKGPPTWKSLVKALIETNHNGIADKIKQDKKLTM